MKGVKVGHLPGKFAEIGSSLKFLNVLVPVDTIILGCFRIGFRP